MKITSIHFYSIVKIDSHKGLLDDWNIQLIDRTLIYHFEIDIVVYIQLPNQRWHSMFHHTNKSNWNARMTPPPRSRIYLFPLSLSVSRSNSMRGESICECQNFILIVIISDKLIRRDLGDTRHRVEIKFQLFVRAIRIYWKCQSFVELYLRNFE